MSTYELGHAPHGLVVPQSFLLRAGFRPHVVDLSIEPLQDASIDRAELALISVPMHTALRLGMAVAERIRARNPRCQIALFGLYAPLNRDFLRRAGAADWVFGGECEDKLVALAQACEAHAATSPAAAEAVGRHAAIGRQKLDFPRLRRDGLPPPARYARLEAADGGRRRVGYAEGSRGCLDTCRHCPVPAVYGGRFFVVPRDVVLEDIATQIEAGAEHITFGDPDFLNGPGHSLALVRALHARWPQVTFDFTAQIAHLRRHRDRLGELAELGCAFVVSAVESLSDRVLEKLGKQHRRRDFAAVLAHCEAVGLTLRPTFVPFTPWTELADVRELFDFLVAHDLVGHVDPIQLTIRLLVPPGSLLLAAGETRGWFADLDAAALTHRWQHRDPRVDELQRQLARRVDEATQSGEEAHRTFSALRDLVYTALAEPAPPPLPRPRAAPRISEPWFCCSEPSTRQRESLAAPAGRAPEPVTPEPG